MTKQLITITLVSILLVPVFTLAAVSDSDWQSRLEDLRQKHQEFKDARLEATREIQETNQTRLEQLRQEMLDQQERHRKDVLIRLIDIQIAFFERMRERVNRRPNIDESYKTTLNETINEVIAGLQQLKVEVEAATDEDTLKQLAQAVKETFQNYHQTVKEIVAAIHASRIANAIDTATDRSTALDARLDELAADGKDVTALTAPLDQAKIHVDQATALVAGGSLREALAELKEAYALFRQVAKGAKEL